MLGGHFRKQHLKNQQRVRHLQEQRKHLFDFGGTMGRASDVILAVFVLSSLHPEAKAACPDAVADVVYVLDASGSVGSANFAMLLTFVQELVRDLPIGSDQVRVGVETYESTARAEFHLNTYTDQNSVINAVGNINYTSGGTNTAGALDFLRNTTFTSTNGDRPYVPNIGIVITDGQSSGTKDAADACRNDSIVLFAVGVGTGVNRAELEAIANQPYDKHVFIANNFSDLDPIKTSIRDMICQTAVITCPPEPVIANGARNCTNSSNPRSVCTYTCSMGYELDGNGQVTCQSSLQWSALPSCQRIHCPFPVIPNSQRTCTNSDWYGSVCTYTCLTGYELQGSSAQCLTSKLWSNQPSCPSWTGTDPTLVAALGSILGLAILGALGLLLYFIIKRKPGKKLNSVSPSPESSPPTTPRTVSNVNVGMTPTPPPSTPVPLKSSVLSDPVFAYVPSPNPAAPKPSAVNITEVASAPTSDAQPTPKTPSPAPKIQPAATHTKLPPQKEKKTPRPERPRPTERETQSPKDDVPKCLLMFKKHSNCTRPCCAGPTNCQCPIHITR